MKVRDDEFWSKQQAETNATEAGKRFMEFMVFWLEAAEKMLDDPEGPATLAESVQLALATAERQFGFLPVDLIGQMLVVASMHWIHGPEFATALTFIERRVVEEALARKLNELQQEAAGNDPVEDARLAPVKSSQPPTS